MGKYWGKDANLAVLPATNSGPRPGDFPVGSVESRAAARAMAEDKDEGIVLTFEGLPRLYPELSETK